MHPRACARARTHTHTHTYVRWRPRTHARRRARAHTHTHTHIHTHTLIHTHMVVNCCKQISMPPPPPLPPTHLPTPCSCYLVLCLRLLVNIQSSKLSIETGRGETDSGSTEMSPQWPADHLLRLLVIYLTISCPSADDVVSISINRTTHAVAVTSPPRNVLQVVTCCRRPVCPQCRWQL